MNTPSLQHQRLARNFTWLALQEIFIRLIGLVTTIYLARTLSPSSYGGLGIALAIVAIVGTLVQAGTGSRATRLTAVDPDAVPDIYAEINGFRLASAIIFIGILLLIAPLIAETISVSATLLMLCSLLILRKGLTVVWAFRGLDKMHVITAGEVVEKTLLLLGLVLFVRGQGNDVLWAPVVELTAALLIVWWLRSRLGRIYPGLAIEFRLSAWPAIAREAVPFGLAGLTASFYSLGIVPLLGWLSTADAAANFLVAQKVMWTLGLLLVVINQSAFPSASRLLSSSGHGQAYGHLPALDLPGHSSALELTAVLLRYYLLLITPVVLLALQFSGELLILLFGNEYSRAGPILIVLLFALPFLSLNNSMIFLLRAIPRPAAVLAGRMAGLVVLLALAVVLIPSSGAQGAAFAVVAAEITVMLALLFLVRRATGGLPLNIRCLAPILAGSTAVAIFLLTESLPDVARLILSAVTYMAIAFLSRAISLAELRVLTQLMLATIRKPFS
jgi:O-antigen/teichoic acid export membrane protein